MRQGLVGATILAGAVALVVGVTVATAGKPNAGTALYPDLRTVVPTHLQLVNQQQRETLRFSNGIANTGPGPVGPSARSAGGGCDDRSLCRSGAP